MPGLEPGIQGQQAQRKRLWIAGSSPAMTGPYLQDALSVLVEDEDDVGEVARGERLGVLRNAPEASHRSRFLLTARAMGRAVRREPEGEAAAAALPELGLGLCGRSEFDNRHGFFVPPWRMAERGKPPRIA